MAALWSGLLLLYLLILYILLFPGLVQFLFEPHRWEKKVLQFFVFLVVPFFLPFALALLLSWWALVACFAFGFMLVSFPIYWLIVHLPSGEWLRAWFKAAYRLLEWFRKRLEIVLSLVFPSLLQGLSPLVFIQPAADLAGRRLAAEN